MENIRRKFGKKAKTAIVALDSQLFYELSEFLFSNTRI